MRKIKITYTKDGKLSSIKEKYDWLLKIILKGIFNVLFLGIILYFITSYFILPAINPNPTIIPSCYKKGTGGIEFILYNPSRAPAEDFNMIIYGTYGGGASSYADNELCEAKSYGFQPLFTLIHCDYIPPDSKIEISVFFRNDTKSNFGYSSWGRTSPLKDTANDFKLLYCQ